MTEERFAEFEELLGQSDAALAPGLAPVLGRMLFVEVKRARAELASLRTELERMRGLLDRARTRVPVGGRLYNDICASLSAGREG